MPQCLDLALVVGLGVDEAACLFCTPLIELAGAVEGGRLLNHGGYASAGLDTSRAWEERPAEAPLRRPAP